MVFVDEDHANNHHKRQSTTCLVNTFCGSAIPYKSKTQSFTASSSAEAEFIEAHTAAKISQYLRMVLIQLGFEQTTPIPIHISNISTLKIINENASLINQTRNINIRYFAIQDWREDGDIIMKHIAVIIN